MATTRSLVRASTLLASAATLAVTLVSCTTAGGRATTTSSGARPTGQVTAPVGTGLLPVWRHTQSATLGTEQAGLDRIGFVNTSGQLVVEPVYAHYLLCPGTDGGPLVVAQADDRVEVLDSDGAVVGSAAADLVDCGPLPGYATLYDPTDAEAESWAATLPDLSRSDLPLYGVAVDHDWMMVTSYSDGTPTTRLVDRTGTHVPAAGDVGLDYFSYTTGPRLSSGEWPAPAVDGLPTGDVTDAHQGYLDRSGRWVAPPKLSTAYPFSHGYAAVSDKTSGTTRSYFVDTSLDQVGPDYGDIGPLVVTSPLFATVVGYTVTKPGTSSDDPTARSGLLAPDLTVLADPATSHTECHQSPDMSQTVCLVDDATGPRLVRLPDGSATPLPDGYTAVLSAQLVATVDGTRVLRTTTGATFDVPAPFHAVTDGGWNPGGDAFVVCESDNGLRLVLDATGAPTPLGGVDQTVTTPDGTVYYWVHAGDQQGYVDATGAWFYHESQHQLMED